MSVSQMERKKKCASPVRDLYLERKEGSPKFLLVRPQYFTDVGSSPHGKINTRAGQRQFQVTVKGKGWKWRGQREEELVLSHISYVIKI